MQMTRTEVVKTADGGVVPQVCLAVHSRVIFHAAFEPLAEPWRAISDSLQIFKEISGTGI